MLVNWGSLQILLVGGTAKPVHVWSVVTEGTGQYDQ